MFRNLQVDDFKHFQKHCDQTMVGFIQQSNAKQSMASHQVQCFYGALQEQPAAKGVKTQKKQSIV